MENMPASNDEWKRKLKPEQFRVLREKGTEPPGSSLLLHNKASGNYMCAGCGAELFTSDSKFDSGTGWPSFDKAILGAIKESDDFTHGMHRIEIVCAKCGGHVGHLFDDGPTKSGRRYCTNGCALEFKMK